MVVVSDIGDDLEKEAVRLGTLRPVIESRIDIFTKEINR